MANDIKNMSGWVWDYSASHGFRGRHAYNPSTGASLSRRQAEYVSAGKITEQQAFDQAATPRKVVTRDFTGRGHKRPRTYRVASFNTLYGAYLYATRIKGRSFITAKGTPYNLYPGEESTSFRGLSTLSTPGGHKVDGPGPLYGKLNALIAPAKVPSYYVWELL